MMLQILPVHVEAQVIVGMHELVGKGVFKMPTIPQMVLAKQDAELGREPAGLELIAGQTPDVGFIEFSVHVLDMLHHEPDYRAVFEQVVQVPLAVPAVPFLSLLLLFRLVL